MNLSKNKILFIAPKYFGYEKEIIKELKRRNAFVFFINDKNTILNAICKYILHDIKLYRIIYAFILLFIPKDINYVFVIDGFSISDEILKLFKKKFNKDCKYIMYLWDGVKNIKNSINIFNYFDNVYTFDYQDAQKYNWYYRPLFYIKQKKENIKKEIDLLYVCSLHSNRMNTLKDVKEFCSKNNINVYIYVYISLPVLLYYKYIKRDANYLSANIFNVNIKKIPLNKMFDLYKKSKVVVDYTHPLQTGFTMRTIECLGYSCKMYTNNKNIINADFYNKNNIIIYDDLKNSLDCKFIKDKYIDNVSEIMNYYSLQGWVDEIFKGE